jgi:hypothetical protein
MADSGELAVDDQWGCVVNYLQSKPTNTKSIERQTLLEAHWVRKYLGVSIAK